MTTFAKFLSSTHQTAEQHAAASVREDDMEADWCNPFVALAASSVDGKGAVPTRGFDPNDDIGMLITADGKRTKLSRWVNHSDKPTARPEMNAQGAVILRAKSTLVGARRVLRQMPGQKSPQMVVIPADEITVDYLAVHDLTN